MSKDILHDWVSKSSLAIRFSQKLTLNEKRILSLALDQLDKSIEKRNLSSEDRTCKVSARDFVKLSGADDLKLAYKDIEKASRSMLKRSVSYDQTRPISAKKSITERVELHWLEGISCSKNGAFVVFTFSTLILPYLIELKDKLTIEKIKQAEKFTGPYTWGLLDTLLILKKSKNEYRSSVVELSLDEIKEHLQVPKSYKWMDIKSKVIENSVTELTTKANWDVKWTISQKTGKSATHIEFTFHKIKT